MLIVWLLWLGAVLTGSNALEAKAEQQSGSISGQTRVPSKKRFQPTPQA